MHLVFEFLVSVINHYDVNGLRLFWASFEWFCLPISSDEKFFFSLDQGIVTANSLKSLSGTLFSHVWRQGRLALDPL